MAELSGPTLIEVAPMKIDPLSAQRLAAPRRGKRDGAPGDGAFADALEGETPSSAPVKGPTGLGPLDALLALQELPDALAGRAKARRRGEALLDHLDEVRLGLLTGRLPRAGLERLATLAAEGREQVDDPRLASILQDIELRAAVELAKLGY